MLRAFTRFLIIALLAFSLVAAAATGDTDDGSSGGSGGGSQTSTGTVDVTKIKSDTEAIGKIGVQLNDALAQDTGEVRFGQCARDGCEMLFTYSQSR